MPSVEHNRGPHLVLTPEAGALLELLQELGHLDDVSVGVITAALTGEGPEATHDPDGLVDVADLRRAVAAILFDRESGMDPEQVRLLTREWHLLFA